MSNRGCSFVIHSPTLWLMSGSYLPCRFPGNRFGNNTGEGLPAQVSEERELRLPVLLLVLPKGVAEPLVGKELRIVQKRGGVLIEPIALDTNVAREHLPIRAGSFLKVFSTVERILRPAGATYPSTRTWQ